MLILAALFCLFHFMNFKDYVTDKYKHWHHKRFWEKQHLSFLKNMMREDAIWLSDLGIFVDVTERHEKAVSETWYKTQFEGISTFRERLREKNKVNKVKLSKEDEAVDIFADKIKQKLKEKKEQGKTGWDDQNWDVRNIRNMLRVEVNKGDPVDVAAYCMFLSFRGEKINNFKRPVFVKPGNPPGTTPLPIMQDIEESRLNTDRFGQYFHSLDNWENTGLHALVFEDEETDKFNTHAKQTEPIDSFIKNGEEVKVSDFKSVVTPTLEHLKGRQCSPLELQFALVKAIEHHNELAVAFSKMEARNAPFNSLITRKNTGYGL